MPARRWFSNGVAIVIATAVLPGCAASPSVMPNDPFAALPMPARLDSPLEPYMLDWRELTLVNHARSLLVSACLKGRGYSLEIGDLRGELDRARRQESIDLERMWGITNAKIARAGGYLPPPAPEVQFNVTGIPEGALSACAEAADDELDRRPDRSPYGLARDLLIRSRVALESDWRAQRVIARWRRCMAEADYSVTSPLNDRGDIAAALARVDANPTKTPRPSEVDMAMADIACKEQTKLVSALGKLASVREARLVERHATALQHDRSRLDRTVSKARLVLAEQG